MIQRRQLIPPLTLHLPEGRIARAWDFKQKKSLVIAFLDANCESCESFLQGLVGRSDQLAAKEAVVLAAFLQQPAQRLTDALPPGVLAGTEMTGRAARAFIGKDALTAQGLARPAVFVTDRYGEVAEAWLAEGHQFPAAGEILTCLTQVEIACEECTVPHWPVES
jgi:peroxiredoxin